MLLAGLVQRLTAVEQRLLALPPPPDSADAAAAHNSTSTSQDLLPSNVSLLANSTSGAPFSSGGIAAAATTGGPLPTGQISHPHHPLAFMPAAAYPPSQLDHVPNPNINLSHFAPPYYSSNPTTNPSPIFPPTYQHQPYQQQQQPQIAAAYPPPPANRFHTPLWPRPPSQNIYGVTRSITSLPPLPNHHVGSGSGVPRFHKLNLPTYDGSADPLGWLNRCEQAFCG